MGWRRAPASLQVARGWRSHAGSASAAARGAQSPLCPKGDGIMIGLVSLVGAGPGDPELLTLKAARRLAEADLVLYDGLVSSEALKLASKAHCFFVGKRVGRPAIQQEDIHALMITEARRGRRLVRLKCGDPFLLGPGGQGGPLPAEARVPLCVIPPRHPAAA